MIRVNGHELEPTIFPDGTSQVWKLPQKVMDDNVHHIFWEFESEAEVFWLMQLLHLVSHSDQVVLTAPLLPYGRQDKGVGNESAFALSVLGCMLSDMIDEFVTFDAHSMALSGFGFKFVSLPADGRIVDAYSGCSATKTCYPDKGAASRYSCPGESIVLDKERDALSGEILGLKLLSGDVHDGDVILIVDDICDGGRTFTEAAKLLHSMADVSVHLYISHGIFSKGTEPLYAAGIETIFTSKGRV
jgi:ribose-phosphate pyrophosphokinase